MNTSAVKIATHARDARETAKLLMLGKYETAVKPWREIIVEREKVAGEELCQAVFSLLKGLNDAGKLGTGSRLWLMAAFAEEAIARGDMSEWPEDLCVREFPEVRG